MKVEGSLAFTITEQTAERARSQMPITPGMRNPFGMVHAGAILWFADVTATVLVLGPGKDTATGMSGFPLAISLNAQLLGNQADGVLDCESVFVKRGRTVSVVRTTVTGANGKLIADVTTSHVPSK